jgi:hypothetical protein
VAVREAGKKRTAVVAPARRKQAVISPALKPRNLEKPKNLEEIAQDRATGESPRQLPQHLRPIRGRDLGREVGAEESLQRHRRFRFLMWMSKRSLPRHR